jgi:hypothetical protein
MSRTLRNRKVNKEIDECYTLVVEQVRANAIKIREWNEKPFYKCSEKTEGYSPYSNGGGDCVEQSIKTWLKLKKLGAKIVQGECWSRAEKYIHLNKGKGLPIFHSWVELGDKCYDYSQGKMLVCDWELFYMLKRVKRTIEVEPLMRNGELMWFDYEHYYLTKNKKGKIINQQQTLRTCFKDNDKRTAFTQTIRQKQNDLGYYSGV